MRWLMDVCPNSLGRQTWLILCAVIVVMWAAAIAGATALFHASGAGRAAGSGVRQWRSLFAAATSGRTDVSATRPNVALARGVSIRSSA
ncbi:Uncharacterised protein [Mycolicibacterium vanbaalenii]|uniref:Uncharacterized protein n=1 Tax=Mycolicibacterium vanbaalenii TaxID=110539 RepID=A0A5S9R407_MYCVN|nr:Uncharacterised protein [Mycolicibacterium vanbaalenii]